MEEIRMKIHSLSIENLHGYLNYNIDFNDDVTFLYGENGCGKTTILNVITSIITGKIYELNNYKFNVIRLFYYANTPDINNVIIIEKIEDEFNITFKDRTTTMDVSKMMFYRRHADEIEDIERFFLNEYPILKEIKSEFNYVYLPLNRNGDMSVDTQEYRMTKRRSGTIRSMHSGAFYNSEMTLNDVAFLVKEEHNKINFTLRKINESFSEELLKSFLDVENISNARQLFLYAQKLNKVNISKIKQDYTDVLKAIKRWDDKTEEKITDFFDSLLEDMRLSEHHKEGFSIEILFKLSELIKINNVISKAEKIEQRKELTMQPITKFVSSVNKFIYTKEKHKEIYIDDEGDIYLRTPHDIKISLQHLSSGEKQIVTFFAYLVLGLKDTNQSIFIVDEPELSLHLKWQKQFVETILDINPDIQLVFATHAPEIIGKYRDKAVKLIPKNKESRWGE